MNTNIPSSTNTNIPNSSLDVLVPLPFNPEPITYKGRFISKAWDTEAKDGQPCRDLVVQVALDEKNALDQPFVIERRYNMLRRGRGIHDFSEEMKSYLGRELTPVELAQQNRIVLDGQPVRVAYKHGRGKGATFDTFLPVETTPPDATPPATA